VVLFCVTVIVPTVVCLPQVILKIHYTIIYLHYILITDIFFVGIPETLIISDKVKKLEDTILALKENIIETDTQAEERQRLLLQDLPTAVVHEILKKVNLEGAVALTYDEFQRAMQNARLQNTNTVTENVMTLIDERFADGRTRNAAVPMLPTSDGVTNPFLSSSIYKHYWGVTVGIVFQKILFFLQQISRRFGTFIHMYMIVRVSMYIVYVHVSVFISVYVLFVINMGVYVHMFMCNYAGVFYIYI